MKKIINNLIKISLVVFAIGYITSCNEAEETSYVFDQISAPTDLVANLEISEESPNTISLTPIANNTSDFEVYFGDVENEVATIIPMGDTVEHTYEDGEYLLRIIARGITGLTSEYSSTITAGDPMVVTPVEPDPDPVEPEPSGDNLLINGDFESDNTSWIRGVTDADLLEFIEEGGNTFYSVNVETAGNPYDVNMSQKLEIVEGTTYTLSFDAWSDVERSIFAGIGLSADPWTNTGENIAINTTQTTYSLTLTASEFGAIDARAFFDLGSEVGLVNIDNVTLVIGEGTPPSSENLAVNGDFESENDSWLVGVDDSALVTTIISEDGNSFYSVNVETAGNPYDVNMSQKLEIVEGTTYTLSFDAWSDIERSIFAGIGLSADPWTNTGENVTINTTQTTYSFTLTASEFGAIDARIIFDLGSEVGLVNIDNVSLVIGEGTPVDPVDPVDPNLPALPIDFESTILDYNPLGFEGATASIASNPDSSGNSSANVLQVYKASDAQDWGGMFILLDAPIDFSSTTTFKVKVWSPFVGSRMVLKIENSADGSIKSEVEALTTVASQWEELTFDISLSVTEEKGVFSTLNSYDKLVLFPNYGSGNDETYYFDDIILSN